MTGIIEAFYVVVNSVLVIVLIVVIITVVVFVFALLPLSFNPTPSPTLSATIALITTVISIAQHGPINIIPPGMHGIQVMSDIVEENIEKIHSIVFKMYPQQDLLDDLSKDG